MTNLASTCILVTLVNVTASKQYNALARLKCFLGFEERKVLINSFILLSFIYRTLVWSTSSAKSLNKLQKRALRFLYDNNSSSYEELLKKLGKSTMNVSNYRSLCIEIFKTFHDINPSFIILHVQTENDELSNTRDI